MPFMHGFLTNCVILFALYQWRVEFSTLFIIHSANDLCNLQMRYYLQVETNGYKTSASLTIIVMKNI